MYSSSHRQAGAPVRKFRSTLRTAPELCNNVSFLVLVGTNGNSDTISTQSDMCIYIHKFFTIQSHWSGKRNKLGVPINAACQGNLSACHRFVSPALGAYTSRKTPFAKKLPVRLLQPVHHGNTDAFVKSKFTDFYAALVGGIADGPIPSRKKESSVS
jgi:hypothetical protein